MKHVSAVGRQKMIRWGKKDDDGEFAADAGDVR